MLPAVSVSRKRSSESQQPFGITLPSKLCSLSESATVPPKDPYTPAGVSSVKEAGDNVSKPVATPVKSTYHYVVPRSCWVCSTTKLTKQKMREVYQGHRATIFKGVESSVDIFCIAEFVFVWEPFYSRC